MMPTATRVQVTMGGMSQLVMRLSHEFSNLPPSWVRSGLRQGCLTGGICGRRFIERMQGLQELDQCRSLGGAEILAVRRHVAAALQHLPNQLILRETRCHKIQGGPTLSAHAGNRVAVAALLRLKDDCALAFEWACIVGITDRDRRTSAPRAHLGAAWRESSG